MKLEIRKAIKKVTDKAQGLMEKADDIEAKARSLGLSTERLRGAIDETWRLLREEYEAGRAVEMFSDWGEEENVQRAVREHSEVTVEYYFAVIELSRVLRLMRAKIRRASL